MKLFVLAIGGTGSRVLKAMIMQFAAGVMPKDPATGKPYKDLTVVPIIIDPHATNEAVQSANTLLIRYRAIRNSLYGDAATREGFFGVNIKSLKDVTTTADNDVTYNISDTFIYDMPAIVSSNRFEDFIELDSYSMPSACRMFSKMLFSQDELNTRMSEGFYGSPNIGTIALNVFGKSDSYKALAQQFTKGDRLFFIGSIFGGTGAAGLPMLVSAIRQDTQHTALSNAYMGALIVMPYFTLQSVDESEIQGKDFMLKTQTALKYYEDNLYPYLNATYYVADENPPAPFENDPGKNDQKSNKAHFVEFIGGLSIIDFLNQKSKGDGKDVKLDDSDRKVAESHVYRHFELKNDETEFGFKDLGKDVNNDIFIPMATFHFLYRFIMSGMFEDNLSMPFAKDRHITANAVTDDMKRFFGVYIEWIIEMGSRGDSAHNFRPFNAPLSNKDYSSELNGISVKTTTFGKKKFDVKDGPIAKMNKSVAHEKENTESGKLFVMANEAFEKSIRDTFDINDLFN